MEVKREFIEGKLSDPLAQRLPIIAAVAGMAVPALVYFAVIGLDPRWSHGWAILTATDIAFALAVLAVLGTHAPPSIKVLLVSVAVVDDVGAVCRGDNSTEDRNREQAGTSLQIFQSEARLAKSTGRGSGTTRRRRAGLNTTTSGARRGGSKAALRMAKQPGDAAVRRGRLNERSGISKVTSLLKSSFLRKFAAAGLASAAAALLYKKSDRAKEPEDQRLAGEKTDSRAAPALRATRRMAAFKGQAARVASSKAKLVSGEDVTSAGPVRTRKKRSDAGSKRPRRTDTSGTTALADQLVPELQGTDTSMIALRADAAAPAQLEESPPELEAQAHPS